MSKQLTKSNNAPAVWQDTENIRKLFAPDLTEQEFEFFVGLGAGLGANPFTREIWAVKYKKDQPASVFLGRDFYRKKAEELKEYDGHVVDAVYANDNFQVNDGIPSHSYKLSSRGALIGAYCTVYRKNTSKPYYVFVELKEYDKGFSNWKSMPATMIKKVAEAQALRGAFQGTFAGTYDESEQWENPGEPKQPEQIKSSAKAEKWQLDELKRLYAIEGLFSDDEVATRRADFKALGQTHQAAEKLIKEAETREKQEKERIAQVEKEAEEFAGREVSEEEYEQNKSMQERSDS